MPGMQKPPLHPWFDVGDVAPVVELLGADGKPKPITRMAGRTAVVHVAATTGDPGPVAEALGALADGFASAGADLFVVRPGGPARSPPPGPSPLSSSWRTPASASPTTSASPDRRRRCSTGRRGWRP